MGRVDETQFIERLQFFNGQRLFASDLQGIEAFNREMRWMHNRSLHQPGVGNGFAVSGNKGDRQVSIQPGYAIDSRGREIVLIDTYVAQVPPVAGEPDGQSVFYDLAVSYPDESDLEEAETRDGVCLPRGVVRLREKPIFCWVRLERTQNNPAGLRAVDPKLARDLQDGLKIRLARVEVLNCQLAQKVSGAQRRDARPTTQPYIAAGTMQPTRWEAWVAKGQTQAADDQQMPLGLTAKIDASRAGFLIAPCYSARVEGPRPKVFLPEELAEDRTSGTSLAIIDSQVYVQDPRPDGFTVNLIVLPLGRARIEPAIDMIVEWTRSNWSVVWMGVEV